MIRYEVFLPNEKAKTIGYVTLFILLINGLVFGFIAFSSHVEKIKAIAITGAVEAAIALFLYYSRLVKFSNFLPEISFFLFSFLWMLMGKILLALFILSFAIIGLYARKRFKVQVGEDTVRYPAFPPKTYQWSEISNIVLKDNVLTLDLVNNKLVQVVIDNESAETIDESVFNEFCRTQLLKR